MTFAFLSQKILVTVLLAGILTQGLKIIFLMAKDKQPFSLRDLVVTGSMPSAHAALVSSLVLIIYLLEGLSTGFFISLVLALIVLRDALGVRRTAGEEGKVLNEIIKKIKLKVPKIHYALGHKPEEVIVGCIIGIGVAVLVFLFL
jgi:uncharacterized protein